MRLYLGNSTIRYISDSQHLNVIYIISYSDFSFFCNISKEKDVSGGLPPATSALLPLCRLSGRDDGGGGDVYPEKDRQEPGHQVEAVLLKDVRIHQE